MDTHTLIFSDILSLTAIMRLGRALMLHEVAGMTVSNLDLTKDMHIMHCTSLMF